MEIKSLDINLIRRLNSRRLKSMKTSQYRLLGSVTYTCECCREQHITDQSGHDKVMENIRMISVQQMENHK